VTGGGQTARTLLPMTVEVGLDLQADAVTLTRALCDIESVSGNEQEIADAVEAALRGLAHL
jgi:succinyl-diaminopimelate desuccinylase